MGAFSIYLWFGIIELKEYPVLNKVLIISLVTYNVIFLAGIVSTYLGQPIILNTTFAFSFWIILGLGFLLFGRRYLIVWRFMSPEYLTLLLYIIAWLAVVFINQYTPLNFINNKPLDFYDFNFGDFIFNIYFILIAVNWIIYFISGPILDKLLGIKPVKNIKILNLVEEIKKEIKIKGSVKVGIGKYPILNAMAYGSIFDKRVAIIAEDINQIPEDELKGIVAHELAHTKGKHTLILTAITSGDLLVRMLLGIPATFYDYTFGNPQIPLITFIIINIFIYVILFVFVRVLEGRADLRAKRAGYTKELVKALYNLESFYASGREIGLNTMLLSKEKISRDNQLLDYKATAEYLYSAMIKPSRASLLSNLINSHPPTYYRIAALLDNKLKPGKEAILPFICLKKSVQKTYAKKFKTARSEFRKIAKEKFTELFEVKDISILMNKFKRIEIYKHELLREFVFQNKITDEVILGKLENIYFNDDVCDSDQFRIVDLQNNSERHLDSSLYARTSVDISGTYFLDKEIPLTLSGIELDDKLKKPNYIFIDENNNKHLKQINKTKLPNSIEMVKDFINYDIFLKEKGTLRIMKCDNVKIANTFEQCVISLSDKSEDNLINQFHFKFKDIIIRPRNIYLPISRSNLFRINELDLINWLIQHQVRTHLYLKKPVNNIEIAYFQKILTDKKDNENKKKFNQNSNKIQLIIRNIFGKEIKIPYKSLELLTFDYRTAIIQKKSEISLVSKLGYRILKRFRPDKIFYVNKI